MSYVALFCGAALTLALATALPAPEVPAEPRPDFQASSAGGDASDPFEATIIMPLLSPSKPSATLTNAAFAVADGVITYRIEGTMFGDLQSGTQTEYRLGQLQRTDTTHDSKPGHISLTINRGDEHIICDETPSTPGSCVQLHLAPLGGDADEYVEDTFGNGTVFSFGGEASDATPYYGSKTEERFIAGLLASCYITSQQDLASTICLHPEHGMLLMEFTASDYYMRMEAVSVSGSVRPEDFEPPYPVTVIDAASLDGAGFTTIVTELGQFPPADPPDAP